jgi:Rap1a immunity proteins
MQKKGKQMTKLRSAFVALIALLLSPIPARPQAVARSYSADFYVEGCKDFLGGKSSFFAGRCVGAIEVLDALNDDTKLFCPPEGATNLQRVQVVVNYIESQPDRKNADFRLVANQAMAKAWPCKK